VYCSSRKKGAIPPKTGTSPRKEDCQKGEAGAILKNEQKNTSSQECPTSIQSRQKKRQAKSLTPASDVKPRNNPKEKKRRRVKKQWTMKTLPGRKTKGG